MLQCGVVGLCIVCVDHAEQGLGAVSTAAAQVDGLGLALTDSPQIRGAVVLSTCNRVMVLAETATEVCRPGPTLCGLLADHGATVLARESSVLEGDDAVWRLFRIASGLESMVTGEREIAGQLKRALRFARTQSTVTPLIGHLVEEALRTSRKVATQTRLSAQGRTVVAVGFDLVSQTLDFSGARVLVMGTGSYAGATCAQLRDRGVAEILVHSTSGRAQGFARRHEVTAVDDDRLAPVLAGVDLVVTCRGSGVPALTRQVAARAVEDRAAVAGVDRDLVVLDLAVSGDVEQPVPAGLRVIDLAAIRDAVPASAAAERGEAERIVAEGVHDLAMDLERRRLAPAVVALRDTLSDLVQAELDRLPEDGSIPVDAAAQALRRLAASMAHIPSVRARIASEHGLGDRWLNSLSDVLGIDVEVDEHILDLGGLGLGAMASGDTLTCPVTGLSVSDLAPAEDRGQHGVHPMAHDDPHQLRAVQGHRPEDVAHLVTIEETR